MRFTSLLALALPAVGSAMAFPSPMAPTPFVPGQYVYTGSDAQPARIESAPGHHGEIPNSYMVILKHDVPTTAALAHQQLIRAAQLSANAFHATSSRSSHDGIRHVYDLPSHIQGYSGTFSEDVLAYIRAQPEVEYVERDSIVKTQDIRQPANEHARKVWSEAFGSYSFAAATSAPGERDAHAIEKGAPWGLARISHREELGFGNFNKYVYSDISGDGVTAYIVDTGIYINHTEFEGRARWGKTMPVGDTDTDGNGHGTHCAGTIGSRKYGVAKRADLVAVKVLGSGGSGSMADVTAGVLWAVEDAKKISAKLAAEPHSAAAKKHKGFVANMSLGGGKSPTLDKAVNGAVSNGLHFAVAAGNENQDACNTSPAGAKNPITVGASDVGDKRAYFSNKGKCVDIFAPGLNIKSTWNTGKDSTNTISGTSMATPHIVGMLAYYLSIYGSNDFAIIKDARPMPTLQQLHAVYHQQTVTAARTFAQKLAHGAHALLSSAPLAHLLPVTLFEYLLAPTRAADAPVIVSVLHPADMKSALIGLATRGILSDLDAESPNLLAFNNATSTPSKKLP
ncbi:hypothetical protein K437DRAFT_255618 [Tilletiaria anomala UBC 951]|uniref:PRB1-protease B, vacuolar n=1 Tax=Tilletiaria anomala (strain ATCC 24038 / CBS 436.72 / UBC 951) TaxID=1037660 RepID=A0A066WBN6_TILAU|nr:uncharacterized protein K437DRAFT_255618 [Tilletiaria anomala UBC 951]KDN48195.1 hypothetical protein K437DRAFT_255618 [Tilletiaria anomala UBC 951]